MNSVVKESLTEEAGTCLVCAGNSKETGVATAPEREEEMRPEGLGEQAGWALVSACKDFPPSTKNMGTLGGLGFQR